MRPLLTILLLLTVSLSSAQVVADPDPIPEPVTFNTGDLDESLKQARKERKPLLLDFWAEWCLPCKQMDRVTFADSLVRKELEANYILHRVDVAQFSGMDEAEDRKVEKYPTMIILDRKGNEQGRLVGYHAPERFLKELASMESGPSK